MKEMGERVDRECKRMMDFGHNLKGKKLPADQAMTTVSEVSAAAPPSLQGTTTEQTAETKAMKAAMKSKMRKKLKEHYEARALSLRQAHEINAKHAKDDYVQLLA